MINVEDLDFKRLIRTRRINGEKTIELDVIPTENNKEHFDLIVEEASINVFDDSYIIKKLNEKSIGKTYWKLSNAIHDFFVNLIGKQQPLIYNGSITFNNYMQMVFEDTGYTFVVLDQFLARSFENLGNDNRLALLQKGLDRFQAEFELVGTEVRFKKQIGNDTDFQFRFGHNIKAISKNVDTTNLATRIRGTGAEGITAEYISPNAAIFGIIDAPPVNDERFTTQAALLEEMQSRLQDEPEVSITIDFVDLRAAGYPYNVPNEGDRVWLIYEPMDDLIIEVRIMEIKEHFDVNMNPTRTEVTLSNYKKTFAGTMFDNIQKQLSNIVNDDGIIKYSVLDEAVKIATEALQSAQTELEFNNGIIAREKTDPNRLVVLNSGGLGISKDGGHTFVEAITADGFVLSAGAVGRLSANNISIGEGTEFEDGYDPTEITVELDNLEDYINDAFHDGIIEESEAIKIEGYLNTLESEYDSITERVASVSNNSYADPSAITDLTLGGFVPYVESYDNLVQSINNAIADGKTTPTEKADVDAKFSSYREKLTILVERLEIVVDSISENKAKEAEDNAIGHADNEYGPVKETVDQNAGIWDRASAFDENGNLDTDYLQGAIDVTKNSINQSSYFYWDADGLVAVDSSDSNKIVRFTSGGIGISTNGGSTYQTAMTADGIIGIDIIGTNIMSFNNVTNDVITLENGIIETFEGGDKTFEVNAKGLSAFSPTTGELVGTFRSAIISGDSTRRGLDIMGWSDYLSISRNIDNTISRTQLGFYWDGDYDRTTLYGGTGIRDSGHLLLRSTSSGGTAGSRVPHLIIDNRTTGGTTYSGARFYVGRDNKSPSSSDFRSGFEVWQYTGNGNGGSEQLFKIDTNEDDVKQISAWVDDFWVSGDYRSAGAISVNGTIRGRGGLIANDTSNFYGDLNMRGWDVLNVGDIALNRIRANQTGGRFIELYNSYVTTNDVTYDGVALRRVNGFGGILFHTNHAILTGGISGSLGVLRVGFDSTSDLVQSTTIRDRHYSTSANVYVTPNGVLGNVSSAKRYKYLIEPMKVDHYKILDIIPSDWYDKNGTDAYANYLSNKDTLNLDEEDIPYLRRIPGAVAEDFVDVGLDIYVTYNNDGEVQSLMYDRAWLSLVPITKDHEDRLNEYDQRFDTVDNRIDNLEKEIKKLKGVA